MPTLPPSLSLLSKHAILLPPEQAHEDEWELVDAPPAGTAPSRLAMRDKDLLVAWGREIRMATFESGWDVNGGVVGSYRSPHLSFDVRQLVVNPTGRLLAVVGTHQVAVVVIPPTSTSSGETSVKSFAIDEFQFSPSAQVGIAKVLWHPLGEGGTSLWVLTDDGKLAEYDVLRPTDAAQTFHFLPSEHKASTSRFSAADPLSLTAVSFSFSPLSDVAASDFNQFTIRVLAGNGDVYAMSPIIPLVATIPLSSLLSLKAMCEVRLRRLQTGSQDAERAAEEGRVIMQAAWVEKLLGQVKQGAATTVSTPRSSLRASLRDSPAPAQPAASVSVHPPHLTESGGPAPGIHRLLLRQGPYLVDPPAPDNDDDDNRATDLALVASASGSTVALSSWSSGRVDVALELDGPEPRWISSADPAPPECVLATLESVALPTKGGEDPARFLVDPFTDSTVYLQSGGAVDAISLAQTIEALDQDEGDIVPVTVTRKVESALTSSSQIIGAATFCNIALGYGLLALSSAGQLATVEMDYCVDTALATPTAAEFALVDADALAILSEPFDTAPLLASTRSSTDVLAAVRRHLTARQPLQTVTAEQVRLLVAASEALRDRLDAVRTSSQALEEHVDVLALEVQRHLSLLKECSARIGEMHARRALERVDAIVAAQAKLGDRLDRVLADLMSEYRPQIGEVEQKWFDELDRLRARVGTGKAGLAQRTQLLKEQLAAVKPRVERARQDANDAPGPPSYGHKQLRPLQAALNARSDELARMLRKMEGLSVRVERAESDDDDDDV
ncbi:hypothetical protein Q5752_004073 [Cryptotrichosporon argae]